LTFIPGSDFNWLN